MHIDLHFLLELELIMFFHVYLLKKYVHDPNHVINWDVIQVEPKGDFQIEPMRILDRKVTMLWNQAIG